jgi:hypothetical protein
MRTGRRTKYTDANGVVRWRHNGRKVRSDKGTRKPHPLGCAHCVMVEAYRAQAATWQDMTAAEVSRRGGWQADAAEPVPFGEFLHTYYRELRAQADYAFEQEAAYALAA